MANSIEKLKRVKLLGDEGVLPFLVIAIYMIAAIVQETNFPVEEFFLFRMRLISIAILIIWELLCCNRYSNRELIIIICIGACGIQAFYLHYRLLFDVLVITFCLRRKALRYIFKLLLTVVVIMVFITAISTLSGLIHDSVFSSQGERHARISFGFIWPSRIQNYALAILCFYIGYSQRKSSLPVIVLILAGSYCLFIGTDARFPFLLTVITGILCIALHAFHCSGKTSSFKALFGALPVFTCFFTVFIVLQFDGADAWWADVDSVLSNRLSYSQTAFEARGLTLFGDHDSPLQGNFDIATYGYVDSGYLSILFNLGILQLILHCILLAYGTYFYAKRNQSYYLLSLVILAIYSMFYGQMSLSITYTASWYLIMKSLLEIEDITETEKGITTIRFLNDIRVRQ